MKKTIAVIGAAVALAWCGASAAESVCPLIPMGAITGRPDEQVVKETLEVYKAVGVDQYLIYARSGLEYEYMGEDWLRMCEWFCKHAKRLNMKIWLYDEYNWPSGSCKGRVPAENSDFESRQFAVFTNADGTCSWQVVHSPGWVDNYSFPAMARFIALTHTRYEQRLGPYLGTTVVGIFTDEPAHPTPVNLARKPALLFRQFDGAEDAYRARMGRDFRTDVQAYLAEPSKDAVWSVYYGLLGERFRAAYFDQIRAWSDRVGVFATGHMIAENNTCDSTLYNGRPLLALKGLSLPGMDEIATQTDPAKLEWLTCAVARHAITRRERGGLAELFACGPSDMSLARQRQMIWLCALNGVDHYVLAVAPLDLKGNAEKNGYFHSFSRTQPWFPALRLLGDDARAAARTAAKSVRCDIAFRYPQAANARLAMHKKNHPLVVPALRCFSEHQLTYDLYDEGEPCDKPLVFAFDETGLREEKIGRVFESPDAAAAFAASVCPPDAWVEPEAGGGVSNLLVRCYVDGSVAVLALGDQAPGRLVLKRRVGAAIPFELPARGVWTSDQAASASTPVVASRTVPETTRYALTLDGPNALRLVFGSNGVARLNVKETLDGVRLAVRCWPTNTAVLVDGKAVALDSPCDTLRQGVNELCRQTSPFRLGAGDHAVTLSAGARDSIYYFPVAWLTGRFAAEGHVVRSLPREIGLGALWRQGLEDFSGGVTYTARVEVPASEKPIRLRLETGGLCTEATMDGETMGCRAWAPFEWRVPDAMKGTHVELRVTVWTSAAPLFGNVHAPDSVWGKKFWVSPPAWPAEVGLVSAPKWVGDGDFK